MTVRDIVQQAKEAGVRYSDLLDYKRQVEMEEWSRRERPWAVRRAAWRIHTGSSPWLWAIWPFGFQREATKHNCYEGDYTTFPGYDEIHDGIKREFPEYDTGDGEQRLFDYLFSPANPMPTPSELWAEALDRALRDGADQEPEPVTATCDEEPF